MRFTNFDRLVALLVPLGLLAASCSHQPTAPGAGASSRAAVAMAATGTTTTVYLHGAGAIANPPALSLDGLSPSATTARYKDSPGVRFAGGNAWVEIGRWSADPSFASGSLTALGDAQLWLGLKNSDDIGTNFDVRAEVYANDALVASGESHCISGLTRNPSLAKAVGIAFDPFAPVAFDGTQQVLSLRLLARIGTNAAGGPCGGHGSASGLRAYFDAVSRPAAFDATFVPAVQTATVEVTVLEPDTFAPVAGATVRLVYQAKEQQPPAPKDKGAPPPPPPPGTPVDVSAVTDANGYVQFVDQAVGVPVAVLASDAFGRITGLKSTTFVAGPNDFAFRMPVATQGVLRGVVTDQATGTPLRQPVVSILDASNVQVSFAATFDDGTYSTDPLLAGTYSLEVSAPGFTPLRLDGVAVVAGQFTLQEVGLVPEPSLTHTLR